jgi:hypothetical protein
MLGWAMETSSWGGAGGGGLGAACVLVALRLRDDNDGGSCGWCRLVGAVVVVVVDGGVDEESWPASFDCLFLVKVLGLASLYLATTFRRRTGRLAFVGMIVWGAITIRRFYLLSMVIAGWWLSLPTKHTNRSPVPLLQSRPRDHPRDHTICLV